MFRMKFAPIVIAAIMLSASAFAGSNPTFTTIDNPLDPTFNQLLGINTAGVISGYYGSGAPGHPNQGYTIAAPTPNSFPKPFRAPFRRRLPVLRRTGPQLASGRRPTPVVIQISASFAKRMVSPTSVSTTRWAQAFLKSIKCSASIHPTSPLVFTTTQMAIRTVMPTR